MERFLKKAIPAVVLGGLFVCMSCGDKPTAPKELTATELVEQGWQNFEAGKYEAAIISFNEAKRKDPSLIDADNGLGWSYARFSQSDSALKYFTLVLQSDSLLTDAYVGRAGVRHRMKLFHESINDAKKALQINGTYAFAHDARISATDVHFLLAEAYYRTLQYAKAQEEIDLLRQTLGLPPIEWSKRVVNGITYQTYQEALLIAIEILRSLV